MNAASDPLTAIDAWLDDELDAPGQHALAAWLEADADHAAVFARRAFLHSRLRQLHGRLLETQPTAVAGATTAPATTDLVEPARQSWRAMARAVPPALRRVAYDYMTLSAVVATLTITIILLSLALIVPDWGRSTPNVAEVEPPRPVFVARVTATHEANWDASSDANFKNIDLFDDDTIVLNSGLAVIEYGTGARVVLEGPATYHVQGANGGDLRHGGLVARVDTKASQGFFVDVPGARIVDLGTEFGVEVAAEGASEVAVLDGEVEVLADGGATGPPQRVRLAAGEGARIEAAGGKISRHDNNDAQSFLALRRQFGGRASEQATGAGTIYVDFANGANGSSGRYFLGSNAVNERGGNGVTSNLRTVTNEATSIDLTLDGVDNCDPSKGLLPDRGNDAFALFHGFVNAEGVSARTGGTMTVRFSNLDPQLLYDVAILSNRTSEPRQQHLTTYTLTDVEAGFSNISSKGATLSTVRWANDRTEYNSFSNGIDGLVARWTNVRPGVDGDLTVEISAPAGTVAYLNALRLLASPDSPGETEE